MTDQDKRIAVAALVVLVLLALSWVSDAGREPTKEAARSISAPTATLIAAGVAVVGTVSGAALGLFGGYYLRHRGGILFKPGDWEMTCTLQDAYKGAAESHAVPLTRGLLSNERVLARAEYGNYEFSVKIFNEMEVNTGLRDITVVFVDAAGNTVWTHRPRITDARGAVTRRPEVFNLPARQWANTEVLGRIGSKEFDAVARSTTVLLRAYLPRDEPFERQVKRLWE